MIYEPIYLHKALKYKPDKHLNLLAGRWIQLKIDGIGTQIVFNDGDVQIYAMSKAAVSGVFTNFTSKLPHLIEELKQFEFEGILQGELIADYIPEGSDPVGYVTGILHADNGIERQKDNKLKLILYEVPSHKGSYKLRYETLLKLFANAPYPDYIRWNPILTINDRANKKLDECFAKIINDNLEGVVLYDPTCLYKHSKTACQRNKGLIKIKAENETEVLCVEMIEGKEGKFKGTLGSMECVDRFGKQFHIGSFNITDEERNRIWNELETPFLVEMYYFMETDESYKLTRYKRARPDKNIEEWNKLD